MKRIIAVLAVTFGIIIGLTSTAHADEGVPYLPKFAPPCKFEDGSGTPLGKVCVWDAKHRGNGIGRSLLIEHTTTKWRYIHISHARAHRMVKEWRRRHHHVTVVMPESAAPPCFRYDGKGQSVCVWNGWRDAEGFPSWLYVKDHGVEVIDQISHRQAVEMIRTWHRNQCDRRGGRWVNCWDESGKWSSY